MLNESAIQKPTKFHGPHCRRSDSTAQKLSTTHYHDQYSVRMGGFYKPGFRSLFVNISCAVVKPDLLDTGAFRILWPMMDETIILIRVQWCNRHQRLYDYRRLLNATNTRGMYSLQPITSAPGTWFRIIFRKSDRRYSVEGSQMCYASGKRHQSARSR